MRTPWKPALLASVVAMSFHAGTAPAQSPPAAGWSSLVPRTEGATHHYAAPDGREGDPGTRAAPWDLAAALDGRHKVAPGDVLWVRGGTYKGRFDVKLAGQEGAPVIVRAYPGERATIEDSPVNVVKPATHVWLWGLEIAGTVPMEKRATKQTGSFPNDLPPLGGLNVHAGDQHKFIDLVIHDNVGSGVGWWRESIGGEIHGCLIYRNGWHAPDRNHGHCIYTQNEGDVKTISGCILSVPAEVGSYSIHAYGSSKAYVDHYLIEGNVISGRGPFLVGGGRPSHGIRVRKNYLYGVGMRIGYGPQNEDCEILDNVIAEGKLVIDKYKAAVDRGNVQELPRRLAVLIPNKYDPARAHLVVYNGAKAPEVPADVKAFLKPGESYRLMDPQDVFGKPAAEGHCDGGTITVPMKGEFAVFVVLKGERK